MQDNTSHRCKFIKKEFKALNAKYKKQEQNNQMMSELMKIDKFPPLRLSEDIVRL